MADPKFIAPVPTAPTDSATYAQIAPGLEGYAFVDPDSNELVTLDAPVPGSAQMHLRPATQDEISGAQRGHAAQGFGQKALGLAEQAAGGATLGLISPETGGLVGGDAAARSAILERENPLLKGAARVAGTLVPTALAGAAGAAAGAAGGLGALAEGAVSMGAEELTQSAAMEMADAAETDRKIEIGNIAQGLLEGAAFLGAGRFAGKLLSRGEKTALEVAGSPADSLARAQKQAATAADVERATPTWAEAKHYAENAEGIHQEINELGAQAGDKLYGRQGSASRAHNVAYKKQDVFGKMGDADAVAIAERLEDTADELDQLSAKMASPRAQSTIKQHAERLRSAANLDVEDAAIAMDEAKKHLDAWREDLGKVKATSRMTAQANVTEIDKVLEPMRKGLEDSKTWGKTWAEKQSKENALWSGPDGIINARARWQDKLMEREAGAAGRTREGLRVVPVFRMKGDMAERILGMSKHDRDYVLKNMKQDIAKTKEMGEIKRAIGGTEARAAVDESLADLSEFSDAVNEVDRIARIQNVHGARIKKLGVGASKSVAEDLLDAAPIGGAVAGGLPGMAAGVALRGLKKTALDAMTPIAKESKALTIGELRGAIAARNEMRVSGKFAGSSRLDAGAVGDALKAGGRKVVKSGKETLQEAAGGTALAAGALGVAHMAAETQAIKELDQHSKDTTERAMLTLGSADAAVMPLPNIAARFQGDHKDLTTAYQAKMADLRRLVDDPDEFIARSTAAFQPLADAGHPEIASKLITRMAIGARYLMENAPPSIAASMFRPDGGTPDEIAILQYAPIWEAVWRPMDTIRDLASRRASPSAVKALREVHPDVYGRMLTEVFKTLAPAGPATDFETKRYLDCVLGLGGALGRSFSPQMSNLLATARQDTKQSHPSLGGENNIAPESSTVGFSKGPTAIR